ncbi:phasin family protein [Sphingomonas aracearum]|uniref:Phasin family protein n=1 Tax=Sphingomonas aracearum TaxID=2283317 RepID=A0A369W1Y0_9SPHN|nr:phasin family protein [Sphingomonas aracearum]RDE07282.1 phasin family protein [Sphingomonas aracearum]
MASKAPKSPRAKAAAKKAEATVASPAGAWPMQPPVDAPEAEADAAPSTPVIPGIQKLVEAEAEIAEHLQSDVEPAAAPAPATVKEDVVETMNTVAGEAQNTMNTMQDRAKAAWTKGQAAFADMGDFSKGNLEAVVESGQIAVRGIQALGQEAADYTKRSFEANVAAMKQIATVKSPTELFKMQGDFVRASFDSLVAETSKNTETVLKLAGEIAQPISNRMAMAAEKVKVAA